jgi:hypothetical protein
VHGERAFGELQVPSRLSVGWWFGTPRHAPFFEAEIRSVGRVEAAANAEEPGARAPGSGASGGPSGSG